MKNVNLFSVKGLLLALVMVLASCTANDTMMEPGGKQTTPSKEKVIISHSAEESPDGDKGTAKDDITVACEKDGKITSSNIYTLEVPAALTATANEWWIENDLTGFSALDGNNVNGKASWSYGKDINGKDLLINATFGSLSEIVGTCLNDTTISFALLKAELLGFTNVKFYDKIKKDGSFWTPVDRTFNVRFHSSEKFKSGNQYMDLSIDRRVNVKGDIETKEIVKAWELSATQNCDQKTVTYVIRIEYSDKSSKDSVIVAPYKVEQTLPASFKWYRDNIIFGAPNFDLISSTEAAGYSFQGISFGMTKENYVVKFDDNSTYNTSVTYPTSAVFTLPCTCGNVKLTTFTPKTSSEIVVDGNARTDGNYKVYNGTVIQDTKYGKCSENDDFSGTIWIAQTPTEKKFKEYKNIKLIMDCEGSGKVTADAVYTDGSSVAETFNFSADNTKISLVLGNIANPINREDKNIGDGSVTPGNVSTTGTSTVNNYLQITRKAQALTSSYNGGFTIGLTANYAEFALVRDGKTWAVSGNRVWSVTPSTTVGTESTTGNVTTWPVTFQFDATFGAGCNSYVEGKSTIQKTGERKFEKYDNIVVVQQCDGSAVITAVAYYNDGTTESEMFTVPASYVRPGIEISNVPASINRDDANIGEGNLTNNGSAVVVESKTVNNYLTVDRKMQRMNSTYNGGIVLDVKAYYADFTLSRDGKTYAATSYKMAVTTNTVVGNESVIGSTKVYPVTFGFDGVFGTNCPYYNEASSEILVDTKDPVTVKKAGGTISVFANSSGKLTYAEVNSLVYNSDKSGTQGGVHYIYKIAGGTAKSVKYSWDEIAKPGKLPADANYSLFFTQDLQPIPVYHQTWGENNIRATYSDARLTSFGGAIGQVNQMETTALGFFKAEINYQSSVAVQNNKYVVTSFYDKTVNSSKQTIKNVSEFPLTWSY